MCKWYFIGSLLLSSIGHIAYGDTLITSDPWMNATAATRANVQAIQAQIANQRAIKQATQGEVDQRLQQTLEAIQLQQKAFLDIIQQPVTTPTLFTVPPANKPIEKPSTITTTNPWQKENPWRNSSQNPYPGQQYVPPNTIQPYPQLNPDQQYITPIYINPNQSQPYPGQKYVTPIYVRPTAPQPYPQQPPRNIFK